MLTNLVDYFERTLERHAEKTAVVYLDQSITFSALAEYAKGLSRVIAHMTGGAIRKPVGLYLPKSIHSVVSDLAILYSGNAYMNLAVDNALCRTKTILQHTDPVLIITDGAHAGALAEIFPPDKTLLIDSLPPKTLRYAQEEIDAVRRRCIDTDPLCILNTSGSTGIPKAVVLNHRSFINYTQWAIETLQIREDDVLGSNAPIVFDHASYEFCLMLSHSCTLTVIPECYNLIPDQLMQYLADRKITYIFWVPTLMVIISTMDLLSRVALPDLRMVWFAGEVFPTKHFNYWRRHLPNATFVNLYGPTEITVDCTYYVVRRELRDDEPIPIGYPCRNTDVLILNCENKPCATDEEGELCVRGTSLAMGYYNSPAVTAAAFTQNPLNSAYPELIYHTGDIVYRNALGEIMFLGRNDTMIKHRGIRIELGEIEHVIVSELQMVDNGCAVYDQEHQEIVFFYESGHEIPKTEFCKRLKTALPKPMYPARYVCLDSMPRNTTGKIDRRFLRERAAVCFCNPAGIR